MINDIKEEEIEELTPSHGFIWKLRQVLNIVFMIGALVGAVIYWIYPDSIWGIVIIVSAMVVKTFECLLRIFKVNKNPIKKYKFPTHTTETPATTEQTEK